MRDMKNTVPKNGNERLEKNTQNGDERHKIYQKRY